MKKEITFTASIPEALLLFLWTIYDETIRVQVHDLAKDELLN